MQLGYEHINLVHNMSNLAHRGDADISAKLGKHTFTVPVVASNMKSILTPEICKQFDDNGWLYVWHRMSGPLDAFRFVKNTQDWNVVSISVGVQDEWSNVLRNCYLQKYRIDYITVDVALSYNDNVLPILKYIKLYYPDAYVIMGNGSTSEWVQWVHRSELVDCVKVGIGVSNACKTRQFTGYGSSTITSVRQCSKTAQYMNDYSALHRQLSVMSDGGIAISSDNMPFIGDIAKAIGVAKADWVMSGSLFSRCVDSPAIKNGYFGNASQDSKGHSKHIEGKNVSVQSNGLTIKEMMTLVEESLRSSVSYSGGRNIEEMKKLTKWEEVK